METERTILRTPAANDEKDVLNLQSNEVSRQYLGGVVVAEHFPEKFAAILQAKPPESYWVVHQKETSAFIGFVCIALYHDKTHYEVSYELLPEFWGAGYGTEIVKQVIEYGFNVLGLQELYSETQKKNTASIRLLEKVGMQRTSELKRFGEEQVVYAIQKPLD